MIDNQWKAGAESFKTIFDGLFQNFGVDYITTEASGGDTADWPPFVTFYPRDSDPDDPAALFLDQQNQKWVFASTNSEELGVRELPLDRSHEVVPWVLSELADIYGGDLNHLLESQSESEIASVRPGAVDAVFLQWAGMVGILLRIAKGELEDFFGEHAFEVKAGAITHLAIQADAFFDWQRRNLGSFLVTSDGNNRRETLADSIRGLGFTENEVLSLVALRLIAEDAARRDLRRVAEQVQTRRPASTPSAVNTNAIAWGVALVIGFIIAVGAAMGY